MGLPHQYVLSGTHDAADAARSLHDGAQATRRMSVTACRPVARRGEHAGATRESEAVSGGSVLALDPPAHLSTWPQPHTVKKYALPSSRIDTCASSVRGCQLMPVPA